MKFGHWFSTAAAAALIACSALVPQAATAAAAVQGSSLISRPVLDSSSGQVFIYDGGRYASGATVNTFSYVYTGDGGVGVITPILFEQTAAGVYTVRGIGTGQQAFPQGTSANPLVQSFLFGLAQGIDTTTNGNFTFGFINAILDANGNQTSSSAGAVEMSGTVDSGQGAGGAGTTNDWIFTPTINGMVVDIGTTFYQPTVNGATGDYNLNDPANGLFHTNRTYSATLDTVQANVPEPGSLALLGAGLIAAGMVRRRRR